METRANYALIGAFSLAVIAAGFLFVWWFKGGAKSTDRKSYQIVFTGSVSGLSRGASVLFNGLRVGEVTQIDLMAEDPSRVAALVEVSARTPVKVDTGARLEFQGLTGIANIALQGGSADAENLPPREEDARRAVIYAERSDLQNLLENVQNLTAKADAVLAKADALFADGAGSVKGILANVERFSKALGDNTDGVNAFLAGVADLGVKIGPLASKLEKLTDDIDGLVRAVDQDKVRGVVSDVAEITRVIAANKANVETTMADAAALAKRLSESSEKLDKVLDLAGGALTAFDARKLGQIVEGADAVMKTLADNRGAVESTLKDVAEVSRTIAANKGNIDSTLADAATLGKRLAASSEKLDKTLEVAANALSGVEPKKLASILDNADSFMKTLDSNRGAVESALKDAAELAKKLSASADRLDNVLAGAEGFLGGGEGGSTKGMMTDISDAAKSMRKLADNLDVRTKEITAGIARFTGPVAREYEALANEGRRAVGEVNRAVRSLQRNPQQLIFGGKSSIPEYSPSR